MARRDDVLSVSMRPDLITMLKAEARRRQASVSAVVAGWAADLGANLAEKQEGADDGKADR